MINPDTVRLEPHPLVDRYAYPVVNHPVTQFAYAAVVETVKVVAAKVFLDYLTTALLSNTQVAPRMVWLVAVAAPVIEELLFRGVIQRGVGLMQKGWNHFVTKRELTEQEIETQKIYRVQITAFIFAAAHLTNPHSSLAAKMTQFTWCYLGGVSYGYLSEKYRTISLSILAHGLNNTLALCLQAYTANPNIVLICSLGLIINPIACYRLGTTDLGDRLAAGLSNTTAYCAALPSRVIHWIRPNQTLDAAIV